MWLSYRCFKAKGREAILIFGKFGLANQIGSVELSTPAENSPKFRSKIPQPSPSGGLQFRLADGTQNPAGEAEAGSAGEQLAKE
jgi:hypothetical protein